MRFLKNKYVLFHSSLCIILIVLDKISKQLALSFLSPSGKEFLGLSLQSPIKNYNLIFGFNFGSDSLFIATSLTAVFCLFFFYYILSLIFIPKNFYYLQTGISILFAGFTGNFIDKLMNGHALDFIKYSLGNRDFYFNLADVFQTIAWIVIFSQLIILRKILWRKKERRTQLLIMKVPQLQFIGYSSLAFFFISAFFLLLNYQFLGLVDVTDFANIKHISNSFLKYSFLILIFLCFFISAFFLYLSNKIYGPVYAFERYIKALLKGENPKELKLRKKDQFKNLEELAKEIKNKLN